MYKNCGCKQKNTKFYVKDNYNRIYHIWYSMINRCEQKQNDAYKNYGGRGIKIVNEWKENFAVFEKWALANGYQNDLTIDRIDNDGNYEPSNCQWLTPKENTRKRRNVKLTMDSANEIRKMISNGVKYEDIGEMFNICISQISRIKHNKRWV